MIKTLILAAAAAVTLCGAANAQSPDYSKAVACAALTEQFGGAVGASKADDAVKTAAKAEAGEGTAACSARNHDAGIVKLRSAITKVGGKPIR